MKRIPNAETVSGERREKIAKVVAARQAGLILVLEDIHDPHNAGAILRTADAYGVQTVWFVFEKEKPYNPKRIGRSSSSSANKWLDFTIFRSSREAADALKKQGYTIVVTALDSQAISLDEATLDQEKIALVFGNEHAGASDVMRHMSDSILQIPMRGMVQSLNVSVSAAVCMAEVVRQRRASGKSYSLDATEQKTLVDNFLER